MSIKDRIVKEIYAEKWETKPQLEVENYKSKIARSKDFPAFALLIKLTLYDTLAGPSGIANTELARKIFKHYFVGRGRDFIIEAKDMPGMASLSTKKYLGINLEKPRWNQPNIKNPQWEVGARSVLKRGSKSFEYSGKLLHGSANRAIANFTVHYRGDFYEHEKGTATWIGFVHYHDVFDFNPNWNWSASRTGGRSAIGERQTRIGYILNAGHDFKIYSYWAQATQDFGAKHITLNPKTSLPPKQLPRFD